MGKRKERRLAAMSAAGRRVKLDLFAEPFGEMVEKSSKDEIKGDPEQDHHAGVPTSPSTSGQNQENPLLLLGQYSDDEVNDNANREPKIDVEENLNTDAAQEGGSVDVVENAGCRTDQDIDAGSIKQDDDELGATNIVDEKNAGESSETGLKDAEPTPEAGGPAASTMQIIGDVADGWKIVMHEQTNQYYYWNTLTGETSWEVPDVLSHRVETSSDQKSLAAEERIGALAQHVHASLPQLNTVSIGYENVTVDNGNGHVITNIADTANGFMVGKENGGSGNMVYDASQVAVHYSSTGVGSVSYPDLMAHHSFASSAQTSAVSDHLTDSRDDLGLIASAEIKDKHLMMVNGSCEATEVHSALLVKYGENLLQRLKTLKGSDESLQRQCIVEVETRLSDCKALSCYGSSLLPFWWHTESQLKRIESILDQEGLLVHNSKSYAEEIELTSSLKTDNYADSGKEHELSMKDSILSNAENTYCSDTSISKETTKETCRVPKIEDAVDTKRLHSGSLEMEAIQEPSKSPASVPQLSGGSQEVKTEEEASVNPVSVLQPSESDHDVQTMYKADKTPGSPKVESHVSEEVDMDVEMEVDEDTHMGHPASGNILHLEHPEQPEQPIVIQCVAAQNVPSDSSHEINVPPPPEEEWIPPPPPEDEAIPPPPPEEPPTPTQSVPPPPYPEIVPSFSYVEQYNLSYPVSGFEYYAPSVSEAPSNAYYAHAEDSHVGEQPAPPYYDALTTTFTESNLGANVVEPVVYYDVPVETLPPIPITSSMETSGFYVQSGSASYDNIATSGHSGSALISTEYTISSLPTHEVESNLPLASDKPGKLIEPGASTSTGPVLVNATSSDVTSTANVKNQPKVRSKKRTLAVAPTLRSNKKVSSLVDKWKAAKEELHGDEEDEPENAYELLEKKRQKEIEEWKARQIASGEAQDNANFLPLGGDWRDRVKRRRAEANSQSTPAIPEEGVNEKKQPDLVELSKDLPSGWQAYWDESSQEVYYANAATLETTWVRPSR